jgi:hypothetical protein
MAKFHGVIGYVTTEETVAGVWSEVVTERACTGDILRNNQRMENSEHLNDNFTISNIFSIISDEFINQNLQYIRYIIWMNAKWKITSAEIRRPRLILTVGGVYNG